LSASTVSAHIVSTVHSSKTLLKKRNRIFTEVFLVCVIIRLCHQVAYNVGRIGNGLAFRVPSAGTTVDLNIKLKI
jgi:hypothetical protein